MYSTALILLSVTNRTRNALSLIYPSPNDINVTQKKQEKITEYSGLRLELGRMWDCEYVAIPMVISGLGVVSLDFEKYKNSLPADISTVLCIKIALLGSEKILRLGTSNN